MPPADVDKYPDCPECGTDMFVSGHSGIWDWICHSCDERFDAPEVTA